MDSISHRWPHKDKTIDNKDSVQLSKFCFDACETLKSAIQGKNAEDLNESENLATEDLERCVDQSRPFPLAIPNNSRVMLRVEASLRRVASTPHTKYNQRKFEGYVQEIQQILSTLSAPDSPLGEGPGAGERAPHSMLTDPYDPATTSAPGKGMSCLCLHRFWTVS